MSVELGAGASVPAPLTLKSCCTCKEILPVTQFSKNASTKDKLQKSCKGCHSAILKKRRTPDVIKQGNLRQRYNMTLDDYYDLFKAQGGVCAVCKSPPTRKYLEVDHNHLCCPGEISCGKCVRALLCKSCNVALGSINDDPVRLRALADYVEAQNGQDVLPQVP